MTLQASVFIAASLDGYIARADGRIDWLDQANATIPPGEDFGYASFFASIDALIIGRASYEKVLTFPEWPYAEKPVIVLSSRPLAIPTSLSASVTASSEPIEELLARLEAQGVQRVYVDGGVTIQRFLAAGCINDLTVTFIPVLLGSGRPLFGSLRQDTWMELVESRGYSNGFVQVKYGVKPVVYTK